MFSAPVSHAGQRPPGILLRSRYAPPAHVANMGRNSPCSRCPPPAPISSRPLIGVAPSSLLQFDGAVINHGLKAMAEYAARRPVRITLAIPATCCRLPSRAGQRGLVADRFGREEKIFTLGESWCSDQSHVRFSRNRFWALVIMRTSRHGRA